METLGRNIFSRLKGDKYIWLVIIGLAFFSLLAVYSATESLAFKAFAKSGQGLSYFGFIAKHTFVLVLGFLMIYIASNIHFKYYSRLSQIFLVAAILLLIYTLLFGIERNDAKRWVQIPIVNYTIQSSDFAKLAILMYTARFLSKKQKEIKKFKEAFLPIIAPIVLVCILIAPEDLSSAALLFVTCFVLLYIGRINYKYLLATLATGLFALLLLISFYSLQPEGERGRLDTWKNRVDDFMNNEDGAYQIQQSKIAIVKGGLVRVAPGRSVQRNYLPHPYSDFIFSIIIEEYGLLGGFIVMGLYLVLLWRCLRIATKSHKAFGVLLAVGLGFSLVLQALINMAVSVHLLPVTGLTLPMVSMGGSSIWFTGISLGIILSASANAEYRIRKNKSKKLRHA